ncbi:MAG: ABC transporter permease [Phycisphaerales bacterium]
MVFLLETLRLGVQNLRLHLLRSFLTALGIILGIAAVIIMVAIAEGSRQAALRQFEILGARNVILRSVRPPEEVSMAGGSSDSSWVTAYGLTRQDYRRVVEQFESIADAVVPLKAVGADVTRGAQRLPSQTFGVTPDLPKCANFKVREGGRYITPGDLDNVSSVCVIGHEIGRQLFPLEDPIGKTMRVDTKAFRVIGVLEPIGLAGGAGAALVGRDLNFDVHIPMTTAEDSFGDTIFRRSAGRRDNTRIELSEIYIAMPTLESVPGGAAIAERIVDLNHRATKDAQIIVPNELLENAKRTARVWTRVMVIIAAIALLVGGIGIMNIMLASVTERTREMGIRRALGATRRHVIMQFLVETGVLSMMGGIVGIVAGVGLAVLLGATLPEQFPTHVTGWSILVSFVVACGVGLIFGIYPAGVAAQQDPIVALRHD